MAVARVCARAFPSRSELMVEQEECRSGQSWGSRSPDWVLNEKALPLCTWEIEVTIPPVVPT